MVVATPAPERQAMDEHQAAAALTVSENGLYSENHADIPPRPQATA